jgi:hypothetical protein
MASYTIARLLALLMLLIMLNEHWQNPLNARINAQTPRIIPAVEARPIRGCVSDALC